VIARGGPFHGTNGILFGPDGLLYMASVVTPVLAAIDVDSGEIVHSYGPEEGVLGPDDLAFGPDGSLYWTDISVGSVGRRAPDGSTSVVGSPGPGVNPITFSDDGRLFVSQCFFGDGLYEIDPEGVSEPRLVSDRLGPGCGLNGMDWGADGRLYGPRWFNGEVVKVDVDSGEWQTVADGFGVPAAVKFDSEGRLHVLDSLAGEIVRLGDDGSREVIARVEPSSADNLAFGPDDRLFVSSFGGGWVAEMVGPEAVRVVTPGGINMPGGLALAELDGRPRLFVADFFALRGLDPETGEQTYVARDIIGFSALGSVMTVAALGNRLVLTSWFDNTVKIWDPATNELAATFDGFGRPIHAIPFGDEIVVTEYDTGSVLRFHPDTPDTRTAIATGLEAPAGLATDGNTLWVSDRAAGRVVAVLEAGELISPPRIVAQGLAGPEGIAPCGDAVCVVEADGERLSRIDLGTGAVEPLVEGLELHVPSQGGFPASMIFNGLVVSGRQAWLSGDRQNLIYAVDI
jgi:sugar lactone lactonase YvrE